MFPWRQPEYNVISNIQQLEHLCTVLRNAINSNKIISIDVETCGTYEGAGLEPYLGWLLGISICIDTTKGWYIPLEHTKNGQRIEEQLTRKQVADILNPVVSSGGVYLGHFIKFDYKFLWLAGIQLFPQLWCTLIARQMLQGEAWGSNKLKDVITTYVNIPPNLVRTFEDVSNGNAAETPIDDMAMYAINDVIFTYYLYMSLKPEVDKKFHKLFYEAEMPLIPVLAQMEMRGIRIDNQYMEKIKPRLVTYMKKIDKFIQNKYGINVGSNNQVANVLQNHFPTIKLKRTPKGNIVTDAKELRKVLERYERNTPENKFLRRVLSFRGLKKEIGTYIDKFPKVCIHKYESSGLTHILHTNFTQIVNSGRQSSAPNVQNIPLNSSVDIRKGFIARDGYDFAEADWKGAEICILAAESQDEVLKKILDPDYKGDDFHTMTAKSIYETPTVTPMQRKDGKTVNFSILYGITAFGLALRMGITENESQRRIDIFLNTYLGVKNYLLKIEDFILDNGYTETAYGRVRYMPDYITPHMLKEYKKRRNDPEYKREKGTYYWKVSGVVRELINHIIQGTCADLLKLAMVRLTKEFALNNLEAYLITTTHDSVVVETKEVSKVLPILQQVMHVNLKSITMPIDIEVKKSFSKVA